MSSKSSLGKTSQYSGVVKSVQNSAQEEPKITKEQVIEAFHSFGFTPNERSHNDTGYWTLKGKSELPKLMEELHKRRLEINKKEDEDRKKQEESKKAIENIKNRQNADKVAMPRLSDEDIAALFDEYGLPKPDPEWARNHMPNDPKKIRSILEMQRKMADDLFKKNSKNAVNSMPEVPKAVAGQAPAGPSPMMGMGGPNPVGIQGGMIPNDIPTKPFFIGDHSIVRITDSHNPNVSTTWLVDVGRKVLRPFLSEQAFQNTFESPEEAENSITTISAEDLGPGGVLEGFTLLKGNQGVKDDGTMDELEYTPSQIQKRYGKASNPEGEQKALSMLDGLYGKLLNPEQETQDPMQENPSQEVSVDGQGGPYGSTTDVPGMQQYNENKLRNAEEALGASGLVSASFIYKIMADSVLNAFYVGAMEHGGYKLGDIVADILRSEKAQTDPTAKSLVIIHPEKNAIQYAATPEGKTSIKTTQTMFPQTMFESSLGEYAKILQYSTNMPEELWAEINPNMDSSSQKFKDAVANIKSEAFDKLDARLSATTQEALTIANADYKEWAKQLNDKYGIVLSDNADKAWKQILSLEDNFSTRGLSGSGIERGAIDDSLKATRLADQRQRDAKLTEEEAKKVAKLRATGTAEEIARLTPAEREKYGLTSPSTLMDELRKANPDATDEELKKYMNTVVDENGNYRSTLYTKYFEDADKNKTDRETNASTIVREVEKNKIEKDYKTAFGDDSALDFVSSGRILGAGEGYEDPAKKDSSTVNKETPKTNTTTSSTGNYTVEQVKKLQNLLASKINPATGQPYMTRTQINTGYGTYGPQTTAAIKKYQTDKGITLDLNSIEDKFLNPQDAKPVNPVATNVSNSISNNQSLLNTPISTSTNPIKPVSTTTQSNISTTTPSLTIKPVSTSTSPLGQISSPYVPAKTVTPTPVVSTPIKPVVINPYKVVSGDTLGAIAAKNKTTVANLAKLNNITDPNKIGVGQVIKFQ